MRRGLTLLEVLVVLTIIGILVALLLPAIQYSRETARRMDCSNRMRQIVAAVHLYESTSGVLPQQTGFLRKLLPYLEQNGNPVEGDGEVYTDPVFKFTVQRSIPFYRCPSDGSSAIIHEGQGGANYCSNAGTGWLWSGYDGAFRPLATNSSNSPPNPNLPGGGPLLLANVTDGTSNTSAISELLTGNGSDERRRVWWHTRSFYGGPNDRDIFCQLCKDQGFQISANGQIFAEYWNRGHPWNSGSINYNHLGLPNGTSCTNAGLFPAGISNAASNHPGGVNVAFLDGHLTFVSDSIALPVWRAYGTRAGDGP